MIIDDHNHAYYHGYDCRGMLENMDRFHIDRTWLLTYEAPEEERNPDPNRCWSRATHDAASPLEAALEYIREAPDRFILGYAPDPRRFDACDRLRAAVAAYPVRVCGELKLRMRYDDECAISMYRAAGELGLPVLMHFDYEYPSGSEKASSGKWHGGGIECLEKVLRDCPDTNFIGHAPGFWVHLSGDDQYRTSAYPQGPVRPGGRIVELLEKYPNLYCDISAGSGCRALSRDLAFTRRFITEYHDRILYGRDQFDNIHRELLDSLNLAPKVLEDLYCNNAMRLTHMG